jgi:hypothetical protein
MRIFGAFAGKRLGSIRHLWTESCNVRPATLTEGVDGNGRTSWAAIRIAKRVKNEKARTMENSFRVMLRLRLNPMTGQTTNVLGSGPASMRCSPLFTECKPG